MTFAMGRAPAPGSDRIPVELFQILKDDAVESAALNMQYAICNMQHALNMQYAGSQHLATRKFCILENKLLKEVSNLDESMLMRYS